MAIGTDDPRVYRALALPEKALESGGVEILRLGIVEDELEEAQLEGREAAADYHKKRAKMAYDRAVFYGLELLSHKDKGFEKAKKNEMTLTTWLKDHFDSKEDAENLFWVAYAWMSRVNLLQDDTAMVADLYIGVDMMQRAFQHLHRVVQLSGRRKLNGRSQAARKGRPLRLRRNRSWIPSQKTLYELVVYEENLLPFVRWNVLRHVGVSYLNCFSVDSGKVARRQIAPPAVLAPRSRSDFPPSQIGSSLGPGRSKCRRRAPLHQ